jgi:hypothetical protein
MTTKAELIASLKKDYPTLQTGNDQDGYQELDAAAYEATIAEWADNKLEALKAEADATAAKQAFLDKFGVTELELRSILNK